MQPQNCGHGAGRTPLLTVLYRELLTVIRQTASWNEAEQTVSRSASWRHSTKQQHGTAPHLLDGPLNLWRSA